MSAHFLPRRKTSLKYGLTWIMLQGDQDVHSRTDYLLGTYHRLFHNISVQDACHNSDPYLVLSCLSRSPAAGHFFCTMNNRRFPVWLSTVPIRVYCLFSELWGVIPKLPQWKFPCQSWISPETWRLINAIILVCRYKDGEQRSVHYISP